MVETIVAKIGLFVGTQLSVGATLAEEKTFLVLYKTSTVRVQPKWNYIFPKKIELDMKNCHNQHRFDIALVPNSHNQPKQSLNINIA